MPLFVGLLDSATQRAPASTYGILLGPHHGLEEGENGDTDLEELAKKRTAGGGMIDSIANMANSILGAGKVIPTLLAASLIGLARHNRSDSPRASYLTVRGIDFLQAYRMR